MGILEIVTPDSRVSRPLCTATLLGRHATCTWVVPGVRVPLFWLELRWARGWAWRVLAGVDETRGPGRPLPGGWRPLRPGERISGPGEVSLHLVDGGPPERFVLDLDSHEVFAGDSLLDVVEERGDGSWPVGAEADGRRLTPLQDGQVFTRDGRVLRFHDGLPPSDTQRCALNLDSPSCELALVLSEDGWLLTVLDGAVSVDLRGELVRAVVPYVEVRRRDMPPGGWLELDAAHFRWQQLGGRADSNRDRIGQDRSRVVRQLARLGVAAADGLFQTERRGEGWVTRVRLPPDRLHLDGDLEGFEPQD
jgi:hypothetical protein